MPHLTHLVKRPLATILPLSLLLGGLLSLPAIGHGTPASTGQASSQLSQPNVPAAEPTASAATGSDPLPDGLVAAVDRDLGLTAAEYIKAGALANQAAAIGQELAYSLEGDDVSITDDNEIEVIVDDAHEAAAVVARGATPVKRAVTAPVTAKPILPSLRPLSGIGPAVGSKYLTADWLSCTLAFWGYDRKGQPVALTAGHCNTHGGQVKQMKLKDPWSSTGEVDDNAFGRFTAGRYGEGFDAALVDANDDVLANPKVHRWQGTKTMSITGQVAPVVGTPVCKSGARTGWTCGRITATAKSFKLADVGNPEVSGFVTSMCSGAGDSGAPVMAGRYAVGVLSFGSFDIRSGDGKPACELSVQKARFLTDGLKQYPASVHEAVRKLLAESPDDLLLTGVVPLTGPGASIESLFGDNFRLALSIPKPKITSAKTSSKGGTKIKGKVKLNGLNPAEVTIKLRVKGRLVKVKPNAKGKFSAHWPRIKRRAKYKAQTFIGGKPGQRSLKVTGKTKGKR